MDIKSLMDINYNLCVYDIQLKTMFGHYINFQVAGTFNARSVYEACSRYGSNFSCGQISLRGEIRDSFENKMLKQTKK